MAVFAVILNEPNNEAWTALKKWEQHFILTDRIAFVVEDDATITRDISNPLGMNKDGKVKGIVIEMTNRSGWNDIALNEWLEKVS